jgi:hypothetical protein
VDSPLVYAALGFIWLFSASFSLSFSTFLPSFLGIELLVSGKNWSEKTITDFPF